MHRHECNIHNFLFDSENQTKVFSILYSLYKNVGKILKLWENRYLIIISIHILKLEISGCDSNVHETEPISVKLTLETCSVNLSPLSRRNETHLFLRASAFSLLKETLAFNLRLLYLDERARSWGPSVRTCNGLLHSPLHCGHVCNRLSKWSPLLTGQCL
jgi:hypothetical protein